MIQMDTLYSHNVVKTSEAKQCTVCKKAELIKLPDEFQAYSQLRNYVSYFCPSCVQIVNFMIS